MLWVGITGGMACGKSTVSKMITEKTGWMVLSADQIVKDLYQKDLGLIKSIQENFGEKSVVNGVVSIDFLSNTVFKDKLKLQLLESLVHPKVKNFVGLFKGMHAEDNKPYFYEIPLLFETKQEGSFDYILSVLCSPEIQKERVLARHNNEPSYLKRLSHQMDLKFKEDNSDFVIHNNKGLEDLERSVDHFIDWVKIALNKI